MSTLEQEIIDRLHKLGSDEQQKVLDFIERLQRRSPRHYTASELIQLPDEERDRLVAEAFDRAATMDFEIFEAYSEEPLDDES